MSNINKTENLEETRVCKECGRELRMSEFRTKTIGWTTHTYHVCNECFKDKMLTARKQNFYEKGITLYKSDKSMRTVRKYKAVHPSRILPESVSGIESMASDEVFARLLDYKDTWVSNYGRVIEKRQDSYQLLKSTCSRADKELYYTLNKNVYNEKKEEWGYKKFKVRACDLVIQTFIVNEDMKNNIACYHRNGDRQDNYYKNLYPVTETQYEAIETEYLKNDTISEDRIMKIVNDMKYKADGWNPWYYRRSFEGVGYLGTDDVDYYSDAYNRWTNMIQRCYNSKIHAYKPYYKNTRVCDEWQNFSNFKIWYDEHYIPGNAIDLDKDLLCNEANIYSPETCAFLSHYLNTVFEDREAPNTTLNDDGKYEVSIMILNKKIDLGTYDTEDEAKKGVIEGKKNYIDELAEKSKGKVPDCVYDAMKNWEVKVSQKQTLQFAKVNN